MASVRTHTHVALLLVATSAIGLAQGFYLPGVAPQDFKKGGERSVRYHSCAGHCSVSNG
jgi:hypothetical protein